MSFSKEFSTLVKIMARLRDPQTGCSWDIEQDFASIRHFTIEEAYEVADAIEREDFEDLCSELGDLILQPVFHAQMAAEKKHFDIEDVIRGINEKLIRRHPHIFDDKNGLSSDAVLDQWENIKKDEREKRALNRGTKPNEGLLDDIANALPALMRAEKLARRVAKVGFDWPDATGALEKCREELNEVEVEIATGDKEKIQGEIGDLLFSVANLARKCGISPEAALSNANAKFMRRFAHLEQRCVENNVPLEDAGLEILQGFWDEVRTRDRETE